MLPRLKPAPLSQVLSRFLILRAKKLEQIRVQHDPLVNLHSERFGVGLRVVDRQLKLQIPVIHSPESELRPGSNEVPL
jgi:hypothetical protein